MRPLTSDEFITPLALEASGHQLAHANDIQRFREFTFKMCGVDDRRKQIASLLKGDSGGGGGKKGKKKK